MKKRQRKKLSRYCCLKCRSRDGLFHSTQLKCGRWVDKFEFCFRCNITMSKQDIDEIDKMLWDYLTKGEEI